MVSVVVCFLDCLDIVRHRKIDGTRKGERQTICQHGLCWGFHGTKNSSVLMQTVVNPEHYLVTWCKSDSICFSNNRFP